MRRPVGSCEGQWLDPGVAESAAAPNAPVSALHRSTLSGLLTSLPNLLRLWASSSLAVSKINFEHYSKLLGYPTWNQFLQFIDYTRSFDRGLELGLLLLAAHEQFKDQISPENRERNAASIHSLVLRMLDKLDYWDEFIEAYDQILEHTNLSFGGYYAEDSRAHHLQNGAGPFLIGNVPGGFRLHFLYGLTNRREVIERKIDRRKRGKKLGNLYHARQSDLTEAELQERVDCS